MTIPVDYAQCNFQFAGVGLPTGAEVTLGIAVDSFVGGPQDIADAVATAFNAGDLNQLYSEDITCTKVVVKFGPDSTGPTYESLIGAVGGSTGEAAGPGVALLVKKVTALGGRKNRGRLYFPGIPEGSVDSAGAVAGGFLTAAEGAFTDLVTDLNAVNLPPMVLHSGSETPTEILELVPQATTATQRRRLRR